MAEPIPPAPPVTTALRPRNESHGMTSSSPDIRGYGSRG